MVVLLVSSILVRRSGFFPSSLEVTYESRQWLDEQEMPQWCQTLEQPVGRQFTLEGNTYIRNEKNLCGIHIVDMPINVEVILICQTAFEPPQDLITMTHDFLSMPGNAVEI